MTVFSGSCVARTSEGMHDLFQAVLGCHKLFCPSFSFPSFYSGLALLPLPLSLQHPIIAILLELYLLLSPCLWITAPLTFLFLFSLMVSVISLLYLLSRPSFHPDTPLTQASSDLQCWKQMKIGLSSLSAFIYLCFLMLFASSLPSHTLFGHIIVPGPLSICRHCFAHLPIHHQHPLKIKVRDCRAPLQPL